MNIHLRYWMQGSPAKHPQVVMKELGIKYQMATPQSVADQWWFWNCENIPTPLPEYIEILNIDPMDCIGWGLDEYMAEKIKNYK